MKLEDLELGEKFNIWSGPFLHMNGRRSGLNQDEYDDSFVKIGKSYFQIIDIQNMIEEQNFVITKT
jgi:hypothetical protein